MTADLVSALSATTPFPQLHPRLRLVSVLAPLCVGSSLISSYVLIKSLGLLIGFVFFGDPIIRQGIVYLDREFPHWPEIFQLQKQVMEDKRPHHSLLMHSIALF